MEERMKLKKNNNKIIFKYIEQNIKEIATIAMIFIIGIILINNVKDER